MSPSAEYSRLSSHHGEPAAPTTTANEPGEFEKALRENIHNSRWTKLCAATAKCEVCQTQGREVLQKCLQCSWCICRVCSAGIPEPLKNQNHILYHDEVDWDIPSKKSDANAKKTTTRRAKKNKTATRVKRNRTPVTQEPLASGSRILPLKGKEDKATQTTLGMYALCGNLKTFVDGEDENVAGILTRMQSSNGLESDRQEHPVTRRLHFEPAQVPQPSPSGSRYLPPPRNLLPLPHTTTRPQSPRMELLPPVTSRHHGRPPPTQVPNRKTRNHWYSGESETVLSTWLPPLMDSRWGHDRNMKPRASYNGPHQTCNTYAEPLRGSAHERSDYPEWTESGPPRAYESAAGMRRGIPWTRVGKEEPIREQLAPGCVTAAPRNPAALQQEFNEPRFILGKRGRSTSRSPAPEPVSKKHKT